MRPAQVGLTSTLMNWELEFFCVTLRNWVPLMILLLLSLLPIREESRVGTEDETIRERSVNIVNVVSVQSEKAFETEPLREVT